MSKGRNNNPRFLVRWQHKALLGAWFLLPSLLAAQTIRYPVNPQLTGQAVYVAHDGITRFARDTLRPLWHTRSDHAADALLITDRAILFGSSSGLHAVDPTSGQPLWHLSSSARLFSPSAAEGIAYVGGEDGSLRAVNIASGEVLWQRRFQGWIYPPAIVGDRLVIGGQAHRVRGLDITTGQPRWEVPLSQELVYRPVATGDGGVIVTTFAGEILALSAQEGSLRWKVRDKVAPFSPILMAERLYYRTFAGAVKVRHQSDGTLIWETPQNLAAYPLWVGDGRIVAIDSAARITVLQATSGQVLWQHNIPYAEPIGNPLTLNERIVFFTRDKGTSRRLRPIVTQWPTPEENLQ